VEQAVKKREAKRKMLNRDMVKFLLIGEVGNTFYSMHFHKAI
jgi:hypothetical protein